MVYDLLKCWNSSPHSSQYRFSVFSSLIYSETRTIIWLSFSFDTALTPSRRTVWLLPRTVSLIYKFAGPSTYVFSLSMNIINKSFHLSMYFSGIVLNENICSTRHYLFQKTFSRDLCIIYYDLSIHLSLDTTSTT